MTRELIDSGHDHRYARRNARAEFKETGHAGECWGADNATQAAMTGEADRPGQANKN